MSMSMSMTSAALAPARVTAKATKARAARALLARASPSSVAGSVVSSFVSSPDRLTTVPLPLSRPPIPRQANASATRRGATARARATDERASLPKEYTYHTPGSVQETDDAVVFAHQTDAEKAKWSDASVHHVGDDSDAPVRVGVVIGEFHNVLMDRMLEDARVAAIAMGATVDEVVWVPGTYEAPLVVERMLENDALDAVCVIGYIEKGSTLHGQEMGATCSLIFKQLELEYNKPVGMGIIGPGATAEQAEGRVAYAGNGMRAAIRMARYMARTV